MTAYQRIKDAISQALKQGKHNFIIYPFGQNGILTKYILNVCFGIEEEYLVDNKLAEYNPSIKKLEYFKGIDCDKKTVLFNVENPNLYEELCCELKQCFKGENIIDIFGGGNSKPSIDRKECNTRPAADTKCGKYSYGPLCSHWLVESVGAFCSFATGSAVTENHPVDLISTHPFLYADSRANNVFWYKYEDSKDARWYFDGINPRGTVGKLSKVKIGNDVWLGRNVIITNGANIGNGVIAAAGAVITKDVPDYAVVAGVPARIIRYRYTEEQINKLNQIAWWDWSDELIRERYEDFFKSIDEFIEKYQK